MNISEQVVLVTGANRGLGRQMILELVSRGAKVYAGARNIETMDVPGVIPVKLDVTSEQDVMEVGKIAKDVTVLINNAGSSTGASLLTGDMDNIRLEMETHYYGTLHMCRAFAPIITANGGGAILNILSVLSWVSMGSSGAYTSAKSAEWMLTNDIRVNLFPQNIIVSGLHVGFMDTDMTTGVTAPKSNPSDIAKLAIEGIESGKFEILADETSKIVQSKLSGGVPALYKQLNKEE